MTGPTSSAFNSFGFYDWLEADDDRSEIDYSLHCYDSIGGGTNFRPPGKAYVVTNCATSAPALIPGCCVGYTFTVSKTGPQNHYLFAKVDGTNGRVTVTQGATTVTGDFDTFANSTAQEKVFTVTINPANTVTLYTVTITPLSIQTGAGAANVSIIAMATGGATAGNISDAVLATPGCIMRSPSQTYSHAAGRPLRARSHRHDQHHSLC